MKKGFTLIELLAVIVILAIIALIATPIILNIINGARESSFERSAENYIEAARVSVVRKNLTQELGDTTCTVQTTGDMLCDNIEVKVDMDGMKATGGKITFSQGKVVSVEDLLLSEKYYNMEDGNLVASNEPQHAGAPVTHNYVYRWTEDQLSIGDSIVGISTTTDYHDVISAGKNACLRHDLNSDNTIKTSEACFISNNTLYCLMGADNGAAYSDNLATMHSADSNCNSNHCLISNLIVIVLDTGSTDVYGNMICNVNSSGNSFCSPGSSDPVD